MAHPAKIRLNRILAREIYLCPISNEIWKGILSLSPKYTAILIIRPHQVGKTTLLRRLMAQDREYVTLDDWEKCAIAQNDPALFLQIHHLLIMIDEVLHPLEIKRSVNPGSELIHTFGVLNKGSVSRGTGAILCMRPTLSAINRDNYVIPIWMI